MNETDLAEKIASGELSSPQRVGGFSLFALRVTGSGEAFRPQHNETVFRDPALLQEYARRCVGIPVVAEHPEKGQLDSKEFAARAIGAVVRPYLAGEDGIANGDGPDLWAICRIHDDQAAKAMESGDLSTSPAVVFGKNAGQTTKNADGSTSLIETSPELIDHLAVTAHGGVWDKGGAAPPGVRTDLENFQQETSRMSDANNTPAAGDVSDDKLEQLNSRIEALLARIAEIEGGDGDEPAEGDGEPAEGPTGRAQTEDERFNRLARASKESPRGKNEIGKPALGNFLARGPGEPADTPPSTAVADAEEKELARRVEIQSRADAAFMAHGEQAPPPMAGEASHAYRVRVLGLLQRHSKDFRAVNLRKINDAAHFAAVESRIYADSLEASKSPYVAPDTLREVVTTDQSGRRISTFYGEPRAWLDDFSGGRQRLVGINTRRNG